MRISDWSSDVCSSDLCHQHDDRGNSKPERALSEYVPHTGHFLGSSGSHFSHDGLHDDQHQRQQHDEGEQAKIEIGVPPAAIFDQCGAHIGHRSEEHTSELQSLMRISYAVFCLKKTQQNKKWTQ